MVLVRHGNCFGALRQSEDVADSEVGLNDAVVDLMICGRIVDALAREAVQSAELRSKMRDLSEENFPLRLSEKVRTVADELH